MNKKIKIILLLIAFILLIIIILTVSLLYKKEQIINDSRLSSFEIEEIGNFSLTNQYNQVIEFEKFQNKIFVVNFFFSYCPNICIDTSKNLKRVQDQFKQDKNVVILSISVDPNRDKVKRLHQYANSYQAISNRWHFLTGDKSIIYDIAENDYKLHVSYEGKEKFIHSSKVILINKRKIFSYYEGTSIQEIDLLIKDIQSFNR